MPSREHVLPTGLMLLVFHPGNDPLRLFREAEDTTGRTEMQRRYTEILQPK